MIEEIIVHPGVSGDVARRRSIHQQMVDSMMRGANQEVPLLPTVPAERWVLLRARLMLEEVIETINDMGVQVIISGVASTAIPEGGEFETVLNKPFEAGSRFRAASGEIFDLVLQDEGDGDEEPVYIWSDGNEDFAHKDGVGPIDGTGRGLNGEFVQLNEKEAVGWVAPHRFEAVTSPNIIGVADGCCDVKVVTTGTLTAFGLSDDSLQFEVDSNNLRKFAEGHTIDSGGKLIKPPNHPAPRIKEIIAAQRKTEPIAQRR